MENSKWIETIGAWGDSITYGAGDKEALGWVGRLRRHVEREHATSVYNFGVSGDTSADLLKRFESEVRSTEPELILIAVGTNDSVFRDGKEEAREVLLETYRQNLQELFKMANASAEHVYAVGLTVANDPLVAPIPWSTTKKSYKTAILREYDEAMKEEAQKAGVAYIPLWDALGHSDLADGLHPNAAGYDKMYARIYDGIRARLSGQ